MNTINTTETKYFFVIVANEFHWCYFNAAVLPGHEEDVKRAILADMEASRDYEVDNVIRLYDEMHKEGETVEEYKDRIVRECTYDIEVFAEYVTDEDGDITCADDRGSFCGDTEEEMAKALPLDGKTFAFKSYDAGPRG